MKFKILVSIFFFSLVYYINPSFAKIGQINGKSTQFDYAKLKKEEKKHETLLCSPDKKTKQKKTVLCNDFETGLHYIRNSLWLKGVYYLKKNLSHKNTVNKYDTLLSIGYAELKQKNYLSAIEYMEQIVSKKHLLNDIAKYLLSRAYLESGDNKNALKLLYKLNNVKLDKELVKLIHKSIMEGLNQSELKNVSLNNYLELMDNYPSAKNDFLTLNRTIELALQSDKQDISIDLLRRIWIRHYGSKESDYAYKQLAILNKQDQKEEEINIDEMSIMLSSAVSNYDCHKAEDLIIKLRKQKLSKKLLSKTYYKEAECLRKTGHLNQSLKVIDNALKTEKISEWWALYLLYKKGRWLIGADKDVEGANIIVESAKKYSTVSGASNKLYLGGWFQLKAEKYKSAVKTFNYFLEKYPKSNSNTSALWYGAWSSYKLKRYKDALKKLNKLKDFKPNSSLRPQAYYWIARITEKRGMKKSAKKKYKEVENEYPLSFYALLANKRRIGKGKSNTIKWLEDIASEVELNHDKTMSPCSFNLVIPKSADDDLKKSYTLWKLGLVEFAKIYYKGQLLEDNKNSYSTITQMGSDLGDYKRVYLKVRSPGYYKRPKKAKEFKNLFPKAFEVQINKYSKIYGIAPFLLWSIMRTESLFDPQAVSIANAKGVMQLMPKTGRNISEKIGVKEFSSEDLHDPGLNIRFAAWYLKQLIIRYQGQLPIAIASYNAGPKAASRWIKTLGKFQLDEFVEDITYGETRRYVKKVLSTFIAYMDLYKQAPYKIPIKWKIDPVITEGVEF